MGKHIGFAIAATMILVSMMFWAKSHVAATTAKTAPPAVTSTAYLPFQMLEPVY